ncbi:MAG: hypothetical protein JWR86_1298 [Enterovirga sp.]|nr:hypothetical protein [Enterovirga sp.]
MRAAVAALERSSLAGRLSSMAGTPLELLGRALPSVAREMVSAAVSRALKVALRVALTTLPRGESGPRSGRSHTVLAAMSGAAGGALGLATLPLELPVSTTLLLRAIADEARREGEDLSDPEAALACLQVFALGSRTEADDLASSGYFAVRGALAKTVTEAARLAAGKGLADRSAPALVRLTAQIASRFGVAVSQKVAAGAVPVIGALGGAAVNVAFTDHFRRLARAHFTVRRLERRYGAEPVRALYEEIRTARAPELSHGTRPEA